MRARWINWRLIVAILLLAYVFPVVAQVHTYCPLDLACTWTALQTYTGGLTVSSSAANFVAASSTKLRGAANLTTGSGGEIGYDSLNGNWHVWTGVDSLLVPLASGFASGHCGQPTLVGGKWTLQDTGSSCAAGAGTFYQTVQANGSAQTQRPILNLISGSGITTSCADNSGATRTDCTVALSGGINPTNAVFTNRNLSGNVAISSNTQTTVDAITQTMPASGGPWREFVSYGYYFSSTAGSYMCWLTDGTNVWGTKGWETGANTAGGCHWSGYSPNTYANGAGPTFTVKIISGASGTVCTATGGSSPCNTPTGVTNAPTVTSSMQASAQASN